MTIPPAGWPARVQHELSGRVARTFGSLLLSQVLAAGFGFLYWVLAARTSPVSSVAAAAAAIAAMLVLGTFTNLGLGMLLILEIPRRPAPEQKRLIQVASALVTAVTAVVGWAFAVVAPSFSPVFARAFEHPVNVALFVAGASATAVSLVMDRAVLGLGNNAAQVWRNFLAAAIRFPVLVVLVLAHQRGTGALVGAWTGALLVAQIIQYAMLRLPRRSGALAWNDVTGDLRAHAGGAMGHYVLNLGLGSAPQLIPVLAAALLAPAVYAAFNMVWVICTVLFMVPYSMAVTLLAVSAVDHQEEVSAHLRKTVRSALALSGAAAAGGILLGGFVLHVFGSHYAHEGAPLIRLLVIVAVPLVVKDHFFTLMRLRGRLAPSAGLAFAGLALELGGAALGAAGAGGSGLVLGWLAAVGLQAVCMAGTVVRAMRPPAAVVAAVGGPPETAGDSREAPECSAAPAGYLPEAGCSPAAPGYGFSGRHHLWRRNRAQTSGPQMAQSVPER